MSLAISNWIHIRNGRVNSGHTQPFDFAGDAAALYEMLQCNYPKFFKMDLLCKWAWLGAEYLLAPGQHEKADRWKVAVVVGTAHGCADVDKKYIATVADFPSPALFVYTLPNIMLGEICIRYGFKGEQLCLVNESFEQCTEEIEFWVNDLLQHRAMEACICGWADAVGDGYDVCMFYITKQNGVKFSAAAMRQLYSIS